jgi:hypothetical protein
MIKVNKFHPSSGGPEDSVFIYPYSFRLVKVGLKSVFLRRDKFIGCHNHI